MTTMKMDYVTLKARQRAERAAYPESIGVRVHRALSWLNRAEQSEDVDGKFIFLWIAFNAAYAQVLHSQENSSEQAKFNRFLKKLVLLDTKKTLYNLIWNEFPNSIRVLLKNKYVFDLFWAHQRGEITEEEFESAFKKSNRAAQKAISNSDTAKVLNVILSRLYTLRNQIMHGGATFDGAVNRSQLRDATRFMAILVPSVISLMMDNPKTLWGDAIYPVVTNLSE